MRNPIAAALIACTLAAPAAAQRVTYSIRFPNAAHHEAEVTATFSGVPTRPLELRMSRSSPGRYALHEFAKNVYSVKAVDGAGRDIAITRPDPHEWDIAGHDGTVRVTYTLFADHADGTYSGIDPTHAHLNMPATFMFARGGAAWPITVTFEPPAGSGWKVATQLKPTGQPNTFEAPDLQYFMDSPTEVSAFDMREWPVSSNGKSYTLRLALHHTGTTAELDAYTGMVKKVAAEEAGVFGGYADYDYGTYTFIADYLPWVFGDGMEHRNSTILTSTAPLATNALGNLGTMSHEFFHSWNMERIRSKAIEPFDFERANMSRELWFGEGFTSYYDDLFIRRAGLYDDPTYASGLSGGLDAVINGAGRKYFSPVEMSMQAPFVDAAVSIDAQNRANTFISYYTWGAAIGLGLDLTLRTRFRGLTLDDYMRAMWEKHGRPGVPYTLDDLRTVLGTTTKDQAFADDFFRRYITGRDVVDYETLLANAGFLLRPAHPGEAWLGPLFLQFQGGNTYVASSAIVGTPIHEAGIDRTDRIVSIDGQTPTSMNQLAQLIGAHKPGDSVEFVVESRGGQRPASVKLIEDPSVEVVTFEAAGMPVTAAMRTFRASWLSSKASTVR